MGYNPDSDDISTAYYDKEKVIDKHYIDGYIHTPYNEKLLLSTKALNYLIQSTTADGFRKIVMIDQMLENKKSKISMIIHDEIVIDYSDEDRHLIPKIKETFEGHY